MTKQCIDCGKELSRDRYTRCDKCSRIQRKGKGRIYPKCKCGKQLGDYRSKSCQSCAKLGDKNHFYVDGRENKLNYCVECHVEISPRGTRCYSCSNKITRINSPLKLDKNGNWQGGISKFPYAFEFSDVLKESIRKRDNHECQNCGLIEEEHLIVFGRILTVHHIDYDKQNCNENNLITVCVQCNSRANFNREYWTKFYQEKISTITRGV